MIESKILKLLYGGVTTIEDFHYDNIIAPPLLSLITPYDIEQLRLVATDIKLSGDVNKKYTIIDTIMRSRGFRRLAGGTNRVVYRHLEIPNIVVKVAFDTEGIKNNPDEFRNQHLIKPFCCKVFEVSPCGTVGLFERVDRITSRIEFASIADDIFDMITNILVGKYVLEDIGTNFMYNWGIRKGFGPVLLDFPYIYELDGAKLYCQRRLEDGSICGGEIDYDAGFNFLKCERCGELYRARELSKPGNKRKISISQLKSKGAVKMRVECTRGDVVISSNSIKDTSAVMKRSKEVKYQKRVVSDPTNIKKLPGGVVTTYGRKKMAELRKEYQEKQETQQEVLQKKKIRTTCKAYGARIEQNLDTMGVTTEIPTDGNFPVVSCGYKEEEDVKPTSIPGGTHVDYPVTTEIRFDEENPEGVVQKEESKKLDDSKDWTERCESIELSGNESEDKPNDENPDFEPTEYSPFDDEIMQEFARSLAYSASGEFIQEEGSKDDLGEPENEMQDDAERLTNNQDEESEGSVENPDDTTGNMNEQSEEEINDSRDSDDETPGSDFEDTDMTKVQIMPVSVDDENSFHPIPSKSMRKRSARFDPKYYQ